MVLGFYSDFLVAGFCWPPLPCFFGASCCCQAQSLLFWGKNKVAVPGFSCFLRLVHVGCCSTPTLLALELVQDHCWVGSLCFFKSAQCFCRLISSREAGVEFVGAAAPPACSDGGEQVP